MVGLTVNLSVGGMTARFVGDPTLLRQGARCVVKIILPGNEVELTLPSEVVHQSHNGETLTCGLHFVPLADPAAQEQRETVIWRFLLDEQRRQRRRLREAGKEEGE